MKAVYFCDEPFEGTPETELEDLKAKLEEAGVNDITDLTVTTMPPFARFPDPVNYDILFFDWGGMSLGNSMLERFCEEVLSEAEEYPSRIYVLVSQMTMWAMKDAMESIPAPPPNIFMSIEGFAAYPWAHISGKRAKGS